MSLASFALATALGALPSAAASPSPAAAPVPSTPVHAIAVLHPTVGSAVAGTVRFEAAPSGGVTVTVGLTGLSAGKHGFHVHEFGDCSAADATSAGGHFNPTGHPHAGPTDAVRHAGDLGNVEAAADGAASLSWTDPHMSLTGPHGVIGHAVIVHANPDDLQTQPTGNAGGRVACGVIGIAK